MITRFAPAPTGHLHEGHLIHIYFLVGIADLLQAEVLFRFEDHDSYRSRPEYVDSILEDIKWLGLKDRFNTEKLTFQSERTVYESYFDNLKQRQLLYNCKCSRKDIKQARKKAGFSSREIYPGTCRQKHISDNIEHSVRLKLPATEVHFEEGLPLTGFLHGRKTIREIPYQQCGDVALRDRRGDWTYHYAVSVDDFEQNIDLIVRGEDILPSTGRQILISELIGRKDRPLYCHHPLLKYKNQKISKRDGATGIREFRKSSSSSLQNLLYNTFKKAGFPVEDTMTMAGAARNMKLLLGNHRPDS